MSRTEVVQGVIECVAESLSIEKAGITENSTMMNDLGADSLDFLDIMFQLERKFGIKLQKEDFNLVQRLNMPEAEVLQDGMLTALAQDKLRAWLPGLPKEPVRAKQLGGYLTIGTLALLVGSLIDSRTSRPATASL